MPDDVPTKAGRCLERLVSASVAGVGKLIENVVVIIVPIEDGMTGRPVNRIIVEAAVRIVERKGAAGFHGILIGRHSGIEVICFTVAATEVEVNRHLVVKAVSVGTACRHRHQAVALGLARRGVEAQ